MLHPRKKVACASTSTEECKKRLVVLFVNRKKNGSFLDLIGRVKNKG